MTATSHFDRFQVSFRQVAPDGSGLFAQQFNRALPDAIDGNILFLDVFEGVALPRLRQER